MPAEPQVLAELGTLRFSLSPVELKEQGRALIDRAETEVEALRNAPGPRTVEGFLGPLDAILTRVQDAGSHGHLLFNVHPSEEMRTVARELAEAADRFFNTFRVNRPVYEALRELPVAASDPETRFCVEKMLREMRRAGVEKDPPVRDEIVGLNNEIDRIGNEFAQNIASRDREIRLNAADQLNGLPSDYRAAHPADASGKIRITTKYPDFLPVMAYCDDAEVRRALLYEFMNRAYPENVEVLTRLLDRRYRVARLVGYPNYAVFALEDKMVGDPASARAFLERVAERVRTPARVELARFLERKRRDRPESDHLDPWDASLMGEGYYDGKLRTEEFGVDTKLLRAYLPYGRVREGLFALCRELFGLEFAPARGAETWHPSVEAFDVTRAGAPVGRFYLDMVPRDGKFSHAACFGVRHGRGGSALPQAALVCNFLDAGEPSESGRMQYNQVITFFHEFGHLLHALLSGHGRWLYNSASYVEWDFIEAPSQLFEEWARDPTTLARFAQDPDTGSGIPADLLKRLQSAEALGRASRWLRQVALATVSLEMYDRDPEGMDPSRTFRAGWDRYYPMHLDPSYHMEASFGHLTGYSAYYYTYVWSLVIARDLLRPFREKGTLTDPELARRYAAEILEPGSRRPAKELVRSFLGREFDFTAFERWIVEGVESSRGTDTGSLGR